MPSAVDPSTRTTASGRGLAQPFDLRSPRVEYGTRYEAGLSPERSRGTQDSAPSLGLRPRDLGRAIPSEREGRASGEVPRPLPVGLHATPLAPQRILLRGDQWVVSGGIIKWHPWLTMLGLKSYHKPMRISGQFSSLERQRLQAPAIYALEPGVDRLWEGLYWVAPSLPFIEAVYGSSAYVSVDPGITQEIYVTPSGYLIKRAHSQRF
ncbi:MAG: hypothetical protein HYZ91_03020 [Candidatus Omnitrophica bacterium]|nr:hypothetical protein [Candidatus Omnitrophota bacterium]